MGSAKLQGVQLSINKESFLLINITREAKGRAEALTTVCRVISGAGMCASIKEKQGKKYSKCTLLVLLVEMKKNQVPERLK